MQSHVLYHVRNHLILTAGASTYLQSAEILAYDVQFTTELESLAERCPNPEAKLTSSSFAD